MRRYNDNISNTDSNSTTAITPDENIAQQDSVVVTLSIGKILYMPFMSSCCMKQVHTMCGPHTKHCAHPVQTPYKTLCRYCEDSVRTLHTLGGPHTKHCAGTVWTESRPCVDLVQNTPSPKRLRLL